MRIIAATNNNGKVKEIKRIFGDLGIEVSALQDEGFDIEVEETGDTFEKNALIKARAVAMLTDDIVMADDSGLCIDALDGRPGVYSARYAGEHGDSNANRKKLLENIKDKNREAYFSCILVLYRSDNTYEYREGKTYGKIIDEERGDTSFGYDCIFVSDDLGITFGEATNEDKNRVSHRYRALEQIKEIL